MLHKVFAYFAHLAANPAQLMQVVGSGFAGTAVIVASLQLGNLAALRGDILNSETAAATAAAGAAAESNEACQKAVTSGVGDQLVTSLERSFAGVLPGAGKLIQAHRKEVNDRSAALTREVLIRYAAARWCAPREVFQNVPTENFGEKVAPFAAQAIAGQKSAAGDSSGTSLLDVAAKESAGAQDMANRQREIEAIISSAIEAAIQADNQTSSTIATLAIRTNNQLSLLLSQQINASIEIGNIHSKILQANSNLLDKIANIKAFEHFGQGGSSKAGYFSGLESGGSANFKYDGRFFEDTENARAAAGLNLNVIPTTRDGLTGSFEEANEMIKNNLNFGLLNLFRPETRTAFLQNEFKSELVSYVAAKNLVDPLDPQGGLKNNLDKVAEIKIDQLPGFICSALDAADPAAAPCFNIENKNTELQS